MDTGENAFSENTENDAEASGVSNVFDTDNKDVVIAAGILGGVIFVGQTLGPLYLYDPKGDELTAALEAFSALDVDAAAHEWPFVDDDDAREALGNMVFGLQDGVKADDLIWEYRRLFVGPNPKPAPQWGSVYTDPECVMFGASNLALRKWMREKGIKRLADEGDPDDHIGLMLVMMAWIAENKPECLVEYLRLHLLTWSSHFLEELEEAAEHPFYKGLAQITRESLEGIQDVLNIEVEYPRYYR